MASTTTPLHSTTARRPTLFAALALAAATTLAAFSSQPVLAQPASPAPVTATVADDAPAAPNRPMPMRMAPERERMQGQSREQRMQRWQQHRAERMAAFKAQLQLTPAQEPSWAEFTAALQPGQRHARLDQQRQGMENLRTPERIDRMRALRSQRAAQADRRGEAVKAEKLGKLTDRTVEIMQEAQCMRMFQPAEYGGLESRPREFAEAVMELAALDPAAGWVMGVVGVHPWQLAYNDKRVQDEVWGEDSSVWMASPYMPGGLAVPVEGGYKFSGKWGFSSGTDHCKWVFLGGMLADADGQMVMPPTMVHVIIPRSEYEIVEDSWDVLGLRATRSLSPPDQSRRHRNAAPRDPLARLLDLRDHVATTLLETVPGVAPAGPRPAGRP